MKKLILLFIVTFFYSILFAGVSREVYIGVVDFSGNVYDFSSAPYDNVTFKVWIKSRQTEIVDQNSPDSYFEDFDMNASVVCLNLGNFASDWLAGDILEGRIEDDYWYNTFERILDNSSDPFCIGLDNFLGPGLGGPPIMIGWPLDNFIESNTLPEIVTLQQNYPNPFNPETSISFSLSREEQVELSVFNSDGQLVKELVNGKVSAGNHSVNFKGSDLNSGIYFFTLETGSTKLSRKMLLIK